VEDRGVITLIIGIAIGVFLGFLLAALVNEETAGPVC
jgi:formate-dependent nitrite reductase membrane component NrfD